MIQLNHPLPIPFTASVANDAVNRVFDTTYAGNGQAATAGTHRNFCTAGWLVGTIVVGNQAVTGKLYVLEADNTWHQVGTDTVYAASDEYEIEIRAPGREWKYEVVNGSTGPDALTISVYLTPENPR